MPGPLISADYITAIDGRSFTVDEATRVGLLIGIASNLVRSWIKRDLSSTTAPEAARLAVCRLVLNALDNGADDTGNVRAEQIGDYRVEFQRAAAVQDMDMAIVADLLKPLRRSSYSVSMTVPFDGPITTEGEL